MTNLREFDDLRMAKDMVKELTFVKKKQLIQKSKAKSEKEKQEELEKQRQEMQRREDEELERFLLLLAFVLCEIYEAGWEDAEDVVGDVNVEWNGDLDSVYQEIDGKTFVDRILESESEEDILRIIDTESHRNYNEGVYNAAKASGKEGRIRKRWRTMRDSKVRDSHQYLEGVTVDLNDYFYTASGAMALFPGEFGEPDEDINCRCFIELVEE